MFDKVAADRHAVDIHKKLFFAKRGGKPIIEPSGEVACFITAVIDENVTGHRLTGPRKTTNLTAEAVKAL
jgi:hypothetical protein